MNGKRLRVTERTQLGDALLATGFPFRPDQQHTADSYMAMFTSMTQKTAGIRRPGAAALDLAYVAAGRFDGFWEMGLQRWDIAAGALLVTEAGGLIGDFRGGHQHLTNGNVVCGNPKIFKAMLKAFKQTPAHRRSYPAAPGKLNNCALPSRERPRKCSTSSPVMG